MRLFLLLVARALIGLCSSLPTGAPLCPSLPAAPSGRCARVSRCIGGAHRRPRSSPPSLAGAPSRVCGCCWPLVPTLLLAAPVGAGAAARHPCHCFLAQPPALAVGVADARRVHGCCRPLPSQEMFGRRARNGDEEAAGVTQRRRRGALTGVPTASARVISNNVSGSDNLAAAVAVAQRYL